MLYIAALAAVVSVASAKIYFSETFTGDSWKENWVVSKAAGDKTLGDFVATAGDYFGDAAEDVGIMTSEDYRHYWLSTSFEEFTNEGKDLVLQYTIKQTKDVDCGGSYIKLFTAGFKPEEMTGDSDYAVMFGPDQCGSTKRVHAIMSYNGENLLRKDDVSLNIYDKLTHLFTFVIKADRTYEVKIDGEVKESGNLIDDWEFLAPKEIEDPDVSKPSDWSDEPMMDDPEDKKPEGYDDIPSHIPDPEAEKPEDWDDEDDGEWEPPQIDNPEFEGEWSPNRIDNPDYKGPWVHPMIDNPDYKDDESLHVYKMSGIGFELWQVVSGTLFDNIIVTDDVAEAEEWAARWAKNAEAEKKAEEAFKAEQEADEVVDEDDDDEDEDDEDDKDEL